MTKGTLTIRERELKALKAAEWAARFGAGPASGRWGTGPEGGCPFDANRVPHVHVRRNLALTFNIDPRTGRWLNSDRGML